MKRCLPFFACAAISLALAGCQETEETKREVNIETPNGRTSIDIRTSEEKTDNRPDTP